MQNNGSWLLYLTFCHIVHYITSIVLLIDFCDYLSLYMY